MIAFFNEDIEYAPQTTDELVNWITRVVENELHTVGHINFIYCSNSYLLNINQTYLGHHTYTDIITFDQSASTDVIAGDIYISIDQVRCNAIEYHESFDKELKRVMVHGVLHLLGYNDKSIEEQQEMSKKEEAYLSLYF